jgi:hypothetical protein
LKRAATAKAKSKKKPVRKCEALPQGGVMAICKAMSGAVKKRGLSGEAKDFNRLRRRR